MACTSAFQPTVSSVPISEGSIPFQHESLPGSSTASTYYRIVGDVQSQMRPLVVLHGGPGFSSLYLQPTLDLLSQKTLRPVIYYDQVGGGNSTHYPERKLDDGLWTMELFQSQLESVLSYFDISNDYDLYGHSWGAMMAAHFAAQRPRGLKHLILASGLASATAARESFDMLITTLPEDKQRALRLSPKGSDEYAAALDLFYRNFICRLDPWPSALAETFAKLEQDDTVYQTMWGSNELDITGSLKTYDTSETCKRINVPTLLISGQYDELQPVASQSWAGKIPDAKVVVMENGSHTVGLELPGPYVSYIETFLSQD